MFGYDPRIFKKAQDAKFDKTQIYARNEANVPNDVPAPPVEMGEQTILQQMLLGGYKNNFSPVEMILEVLAFLKATAHKRPTPLIKELEGRQYIDVEHLEQELKKIQAAQPVPEPKPRSPRPGSSL